MADPEPDTTGTASTEQSFAGIMNALVELMRAGARPDVLEAQRLLLQRLANQGDVFPSRIPLPRNITEVGGYLNLLEVAGQFDMRLSAIASALGVAGPAAASSLTGAVPPGFVDVPNDRPAGPAQPSIPPPLAVRADFHAPLLAALEILHASGCVLPLRAPTCDPAGRAAWSQHRQRWTPPQRWRRSDGSEVFPGTVLVDPTADALAIAAGSKPPQPIRSGSSRANSTTAR